MVILLAVTQVKTERLTTAEKTLIMHSIQTGSWSCSVVAFVDVEGLADTVIAAAAVILAVVAGVAAGASAH